MTDRRSLMDGSTTPTQERANVFGDEFEVDDEFDGIADGFRPGMGPDERVAHTRQDEADGHPVTSISAYYGQDAITPLSTVQSRNSVRKSRATANPFSSPEDEEPPATPTGTGRDHSLEFEPDVRRSVSSASSSHFAPTHSPRFGAGPSHPYSIYPQGTMGRTLSQTTASTVRAPSTRQSYSQRRPQHPYAMYPQGVGDDMDDDDDGEDYAIQQNPVPVGFPGLGGDYTRRLGPDGEDQDLIGELGHTEQLPPYTRYPEDGPEKVPLLMPTAPTALHSVAPVAGTDPSMPLMHTMITPSEQPRATQSMTDESALHRQSSRLSAQQLMSSRSSVISSSTPSYDKDRKWSDKTWKERSKHRVCCGIPAWCILLAVCVIVFIAAVIGGVIGGFVAGGRHARDQTPTVTVVTSLYDASLIASPTSGAPPTGTFALTLGQPEETQHACLANNNEKIAWSCDLSPNSALGITIGPPSDGKGSGANILYASTNASIGYGAQVNNMNTSFAQFLTVQDNDDKANGPAFYFQQFYDKVVVVPEDAITVPNSKQKRGYFTPGWQMPDEWRHRRQVAQPGEQPWFCVWNGTFLEGFIYVTETFTISTSTSTSSHTFQTSSPTLPASAAATPTDTNGLPMMAAAPTEPPDIITKTWSADITTATFVGPASELNGWASSVMDAAKSRVFEAKMAEKHRESKRQEIHEDDYWSHLPLFPYLVKLEERRLPNNPIAPYCQQYQILDNGNANWVGDNDGNPIRVELTELDPNYSDANIITTTKRRTRRQNTPNACHCQWMSGEQK